MRDVNVLRDVFVSFPAGPDEIELAVDPGDRTVDRPFVGGIGDLADRFPHELSGGELKRAAIARALLTEPVLLIADEPTTGLDSGTGRIILEYLSEYVYSGHAVLVATHDDHVKEYAGQVFDIQKPAAGL